MLRRLAQRPFPSMIMAMCAGRRCGSMASASAHSREPPFRTPNKSFMRLDLHGTPADCMLHRQLVFHGSYTHLMLLSRGFQCLGALCLIATAMAGDRYAV